MRTIITLAIIINVLFLALMAKQYWNNRNRNIDFDDSEKFYHD